MTEIATPASIAPASAKAASSDIRVWDLPLRLFHWLLAGTILLAFVSAEEGSGLSQWHVASGWVAAILIGFRLLWGFIGGQHARFVNFIKPGRVIQHVSGLLGGRVESSLGHNPLGGMVTILLLFTVAAVVWTGTNLTVGGENGEDLHEGIANALIVLVGLHVAGVIVMSLLSKENLVKAMISGRKSRDLHPGAADATPAPGIAVPVAALAIAAGAYGVLQVDAGAFSPSAHGEAGEADGRDDD